LGQLGTPAGAALAVQFLGDDHPPAVRAQALVALAALPAMNRTIRKEEYTETIADPRGGGVQRSDAAGRECSRRTGWRQDYRALLAKTDAKPRNDLQKFALRRWSGPFGHDPLRCARWSSSGRLPIIAGVIRRQAR